ncbi:MAG TPA: RNase adapter RapZ [Acidimicrobiia bacterium]|nr:RNase adapter RapZ [Acidimicrobiia bacterium]
MRQVTVITGMSGAGRSAAADVFEDLGWFVIDNMPPALITKVGDSEGGKESAPLVALVVDVRAGDFMADLTAALAELRSRGAATGVLFLDAADDVLVRRYEASRRKHPMAGGERVSEGIAAERVLLGELKGQADVVIDTSDLNVHELRDRIVARFGDAEQRVGSLQTSVVSFGYKHGLPLDVDLVLDCRFLPNPHWVDDLRPLDGTDDRVREYVLGQPEAHAFLAELERLLALLLPAYVREGKAYLSIAMGCTGGRHRSVVIASELAEVLERLGFAPTVHHRDIDRD